LAGKESIYYEGNGTARKYEVKETAAGGKLRREARM
jgi:hypothetical protein